jgi:hypothetical protein
MRAMSPNLLSETLFKATTEGKMLDVTQQPGGYVRIVGRSECLQAAAKFNVVAPR